MRRKMRLHVGIASVSLTMLTTLTACGQSDTLAAAATGAETGPTAPPESDGTTAAPLSDDVTAAMEEGGTRVAHTEEQPKVSAEQAQSAAAKVFGAFTGGALPTQQGIARVTSANFGEKEDPKDPASPVQLTVQDRLCWVLVYKGALQPRGAVPGRERATEGTGMMKSTLYVLVDANTGEYLRAESLPTIN